MKIKFIDYHGRRAGVFSVLSTDMLGKEGVFSSGGLPNVDGGSYQSESGLTIGRRYAEPFKKTIVDKEGLVKVIENTKVEPTNTQELSEMNLILPLHPHILECMQKAGLPTKNAIPLMKYLGIKNEWFDAPDYTIQRALAEQGITSKQENYEYVSAISGRTALEGSPNAFKLYAQDTIEITKALIKKLRREGLK